MSNIFTDPAGVEQANSIHTDQTFPTSGRYTIENIREHVRRGFDRRNDKNIIEVFYRFATFRFPDIAKRDAFGRSEIVRPCDAAGSHWLISKEKIRSALEDQDILIEQEDIDKFFYIIDMDDNKGLDFIEFKKAILVS